MDELKTTQINGLKIRPPDLNNGGKSKPIKGKEIIDTAYPNIYILAKKNSGKTTVIYNMLPKMASKRRTNIIIISSTVDKDATWIATIKKLEDDGFRVITFTSVVDDGINVIEDLLKMIDENKKQLESDDEEDSGYHILNMGKDRKYKQKKPTIEGDIFDDFDERDDYLIVLDDVSTELKSKTLEKMMKKNRHYKIKLIVSSQHYADLPLGARKNIDLFLLFPLINDSILKNIYESTGCPYSQDLFISTYKRITSPDKPGEKSYNFMYYDVATCETRKNLNERVELQ